MISKNKFEIVEKFKDLGLKIEIPTRKTTGSAGYDIRIIRGGKIKPGETKVFDTGLKVSIEDGYFLSLNVRSSVGIKMNLMLANTVGVIDSDYYNNDENEGHIMVALTNFGSRTQWVQDGERVVQGIFIKYGTTIDEVGPKEKRIGGIGSTN